MPKFTTLAQSWSASVQAMADGKMLIFQDTQTGEVIQIPMTMDMAKSIGAKLMIDTPLPGGNGASPSEVAEQLLRDARGGQQG